MIVKGDRKHQLLFWLILVGILGIMLACNGFTPKDERLRPPISVIGKTFHDFLDQLRALPVGAMMAPWIFQPPDVLYQAGPKITVSGAAAYFPDASLVVYQVEPEDDLTGVVSMDKELSRTTVDPQYNWSVEVSLPANQQYLAARLERPLGRMSPFSNIVYLAKNEAVKLEITTPKEGDVLRNEKVSLTGRGEPHVGLTLSINGENTPFTTKIDANGGWRFEEVPLVVRGFDSTKLKTDPNENTLEVRATALNQTATVKVWRIDPIRLEWPFGKLENGVYQPTPYSSGYMTSFEKDDYHYFVWCKNENKEKCLHPGLDIVNKDDDLIHAAAAGKVVAIGAMNTGANYVIVDSGGWGVMYLHIVENAESLSKEPLGIKVGVEVRTGQVIATQGSSGTEAKHLHLETHVWGLGANRANLNVFLNSELVNLNPPNQYNGRLRSTYVNLYDDWGGNAYCSQDGCLPNVDWSRVPLGPTQTPSMEYSQGCWINNFKTWSTGIEKYGLSTRARYCLAHSEKCVCPSQ